MNTSPISIHCSTCGADVLEQSYAWARNAQVTCAACLAVRVCVNCRRPFAEDEPQFVYTATRLIVGPFCDVCEGVLKIARAICR